MKEIAIKGLKSIHVVIICLIVVSVSFFLRFTHNLHATQTSGHGTISLEKRMELELYIANLEKEIGKITSVSQATKTNGSSNSRSNQEVFQQNIPVVASVAPNIQVSDTVAATSAPLDSSNLKTPSFQSNTLTKDSPDIHDWYNRLSMKYTCMTHNRGALYLYHVRKAAGTSVRDVLMHSSNVHSIPYYETEGLTLDQTILDVPGLFSVTSLRDPVERIVSLYWYEHVGWHHGIKHEMHKCRSFREWVTAWRDSSDFKRTFVHSNPSNNYVEIENYYVKMLIGWRDFSSAQKNGTVLTRYHLDQAKEILSKFDLVLIMEWLRDNTEIDAINALFPGRNNIAVGHSVRGDKDSRTKLKDLLAKDEEEVLKILREINALDIELFEYAKSLLAKRLKFVPGLVEENRHIGISLNNQHCGLFDEYSSSLKQLLESTHHQRRSQRFITAEEKMRLALIRPYEKYIGIFRPPGHKGP